MQPHRSHPSDDRYRNPPSSSSRPPLLSTHHLPPPIPSPSAVYSPRHADNPGYGRDSGWDPARHPDTRSRWSPTLAALSPRQPDVSGPGPSSHAYASRERDRDRDMHQLPPITDLSHRPHTSWDRPPATSYSSSSRPPSSYYDQLPLSPLQQRYSFATPYQREIEHDSRLYHPPTSEYRARPSSRQLPPHSQTRSMMQSQSSAMDPPEPSYRPRESPQLDTGKKKKRRVALSCAECAKRKQKCNRETPCQHCISRRVPELCVPYTRPEASPPPALGEARREVKLEQEGQDISASTSTSAPPTAPRPPSMLPTLSVRVTRLEAMVNTMINRVPGLEDTKALSDWRINHAPVLSPPRTRILEREQSALSSPRSRAPSIERQASAGPEPDAEGGDVSNLDVESSTRNPLPQSMMRGAPLSRNYHGTPAEQLQRLFQDCGVSPRKVTELIAELPKQPLADRLVDWFFNKFNFVRYPISEMLFRQSFVGLYQHQTISPGSVVALPLVFIVFAIASRVAPGAWIEGEDNRTYSLRMYWNSRSAIIMASAVMAENLQLVETRICTGLYLILMHDRRLAEGWAEFRAALTTAQAIGLHRDGSKLGLDPFMTEYKRRLWSYLVHADGTYSCLLGRPISIDPLSCDTLPPSNLDLQSFRDGPTPPNPLPMTTPTFATYLILRRRLGEIVARVTQHFQRLHNTGGYKDIEALDAEFKLFREELPPAFKYFNPDRSWDETCWYLPLHRYYIQTEILHFTIILHRPWLLRKLRSTRYQRSRRACFEAAVDDYKLRLAWKIECPDFFETLIGSSFREFNAAMIAGISMIIDPRGTHAADMRQIVQDFMNQHPHDAHSDGFSQKEAAIIHTLHARAMEMEEKRSKRATKARPTVSNERSTKASGEAPSSNSSIESSASQPSQPKSDRQTRSGQKGKAKAVENDAEIPVLKSQGSSGSEDGARPAKTPVSQFKLDQQGVAGLTPASSSPEEDQPQRLLNQWLMLNTSFGPGSDSFSHPYANSFQSYPIPQYQLRLIPQRVFATPGATPGMAEAVGLGAGSSSGPTALGGTYLGPNILPGGNVAIDLTTGFISPPMSGNPSAQEMKNSGTTAGASVGLGIDQMPTAAPAEFTYALPEMNFLPATYGSTGPLLGQEGAAASAVAGGGEAGTVFGDAEVARTQQAADPAAYWNELIDGMLLGQGYDSFGNTH